MKNKTLTLIALSLLTGYTLGNEGNAVTPVPIVVVTGTKTEKPLNESPVPVSVITAQSIKEKAATSLEDILKDLPGIQLKGMHGQQGQEIIMQGMSAEHVLILIDGVPVNQTDSAINLERLNIAHVKHIEIVPGASSALYGSSAMGGVINIITQKETEGYFKTAIGTERATNHTDPWPNQTSVDAQLGHTLFSGFLDHALSVTVYDGLKIQNDAYSDETASGVRWSLSERFHTHNLNANILWNAGLLERPYLEQRANNSIEKRKTERSHELSTGLKYSGPISEHVVQLDADFYTTLQDAIETPTTVELTRRAQSYAGRYSNQWDRDWGSHTVSIGSVAFSEFLNQEKETPDSIETEINKKHRTSIEAFVQDDWSPSETLDVISGARLQWDSGFGSFFSPKVSTRWNAWEGLNADIYVRASAGVGYRVPDLKQRYYEFDHSHLGYIVLGNPDAEPETAFSFQAELGGNIAAGFNLISWSVNAYRQDVQNLLTLEVDNESANADASIDTFRTQNIGEAIIQGIDASVNWPTTLLDQEFTHALSAHYLDAFDKTADLAINERPELSAKFSQRIATNFLGNLVISNQLNFTGEQWSDAAAGEKANAYFTVDSHATANLVRNWQMTIGVRNVTNTNNTTSNNPVAPTLGRTYQVTLRYQP